MSLENKKKQEKLFAFEINAILRAIRTLASGIMALNNRRNWEFISGSSQAFTGGGYGVSHGYTAPDNANFAIVDVYYGANTGWPYQNRTQFIVARNGATSAEERNYSLYSNSNTLAAAVGWSGNTVTVSTSWVSSITWGGASNIKFYT